MLRTLRFFGTTILAALGSSKSAQCGFCDFACIETTDDESSVIIETVESHECSVTTAALALPGGCLSGEPIDVLVKQCKWLPSLEREPVSATDDARRTAVHLMECLALSQFGGW